jgi:hypothetical protein
LAGNASSGVGGNNYIAINTSFDDFWLSVKMSQVYRIQFSRPMFFSVTVRTKQNTLIKLLLYFIIDACLLKVCDCEVFLGWVYMVKIKGSRAFIVPAPLATASFIVNRFLLYAALSLYSLIVRTRLAVGYKISSLSSPIELAIMFGCATATAQFVFRYWHLSLL